MAAKQVFVLEEPGGEEVFSNSHIRAVQRANAQEAQFRSSAALERHVKPRFAGEETPGRGQGFQGLIGCSPALRQVIEQVRTVAPTNSTVLILGETGTGKELAANAIHNLSERRQRNFVKLSCAAMPAGLLESELFGHERGAYTGAITRTTGRFELADKGTLFLDEVGDIPLELQAKLLRVLQEREFERLGSTQTQRVNVRLVAATNRDLARLVSQKEFRSDLFYRLNVFPIFLPPLRARREDIPCLAEHFVRTFAEGMNKRITEIPRKAMQAMEEYAWPGNVRELQNFIERSVILSPGSVLCPPLTELRESAGVEGLEAVTLDEAQRDHIRRTLERTNWVIAGPRGAARRLGLKRSTLQYRIRKLGISRSITGVLTAQCE